MFPVDAPCRPRLGTKLGDPAERGKCASWAQRPRGAGTIEFNPAGPISRGGLSAMLQAMSSPATIHVPVLPQEVLQWLAPQPGQIIVDGTLGGGGHTRLLAERVTGSAS